MLIPSFRKHRPIIMASSVDQVDRIRLQWTNFQGRGQIMKVDKLSDKVDKILEKIYIHSEFFIYSSITN